MRKEWEMQFVLGGREALDAMAHAPFDVVISDMRMPGMDGAELLERVKQQFSRTVRMVLSGQSDRDTIFRSTKPTHQYFSKPCDVEELKQKLIRALALRDVLDNPKLMQWVSQVETVPSLPSLCQSLRSLLASPAASIAAVADIVVQDMGMTAKLLQLVNSAFLGVAERGSDPRRAASVIGIENLRALVSHDFFPNCPPRWWRNSMACGRIAMPLPPWRRPSYAPRACPKVWPRMLSLPACYTTSGSWCWHRRAAKNTTSAIRLAVAEHSTLVEGEQGVFGTTHAQVGAYLLGLWGLPDAVVEAVAWHHAPALARPKSFSPLIAVHVANFLDRELHPSRADVESRRH